MKILASLLAAFGFATIVNADAIDKKDMDMDKKMTNCNSTLPKDTNETVIPMKPSARLRRMNGNSYSNYHWNWHHNHGHHGHGVGHGHRHGNSHNYHNNNNSNDS